MSKYPILEMLDADPSALSRWQQRAARHRKYAADGKVCHSPEKEAALAKLATEIVDALKYWRDLPEIFLDGPDEVDAIRENVGKYYAMI